MDGWKISPFYGTSSSIGVAVPLPPIKNREVEQGKGTADQLMPLGYLFSLFLSLSFSLSFSLLLLLLPVLILLIFLPLSPTPGV